MSFIYKNPSMSHEEATTFLMSDVETDVAEALVSIGLNEQDEAWAQNTCLEYMSRENQTIVSAAVCAVGHLARRQVELDVEALDSALSKVKKRFPALEGIVADALEDIALFT